MSENAIRETILSQLGKIAPEADLASLQPSENLREALDIDSFDFLNFLIGLHEKLGVEIPESDYGRLTTIEEIESYLSARAK